MKNINWTLVLVAIIAAIPPSLLSTATLIQGIRTHKTFNSKMDTMLDLAKAGAYAEGRKDQKEGKPDH